MGNAPQINAPPPPPPPPHPPTLANASVQQASLAQQQAAMGAAGKGFNGTLLTGPQGDNSAKTTKQTLGSG